MCVNACFFPKVYKDYTLISYFICILIFNIKIGLQQVLVYHSSRFKQNISELDCHNNQDSPYLT